MTPHRLAVGLLAAVALAVPAVGAAPAFAQAPGAQSAVVADDATGTYHPLNSTRLLDTRTTNGGHQGPLGAGTDNKFDLAVGGRGGVPATNVSAVVLNVTADKPTTSTYLKVYPAGQDLPTASTLNLPAGATRANLVTVPLGTAGKVSLYNYSSTVRVVVDVLGYYSATSTAPMGDQFYLNEPTRLFDSRTDGGALFPNEVVTLGADFGSVENPTITAVALNVTAVSPTSGGHLIVWDGASALPTASNLNFATGQIVPNMAITKTVADPSDGVPIFKFKNVSAGSTDVIVDIVGVYETGQPSGLRFRPLAPTRIVDTRVPTGTVKTPLGSHEARLFTAPASVAGDATWALVANTVAVAPTLRTYLTVWADGTARPIPASNLNAFPGEVVANATITPMGPGNKFRIYNDAGQTNTVMDVTGSFEAFEPPAVSAQKALTSRSAAGSVVVDAPSATVSRSTR